MAWQGKVYVTASNPFPGQQRPIEGDPEHTLSDQGLGINTYVAGGPGPSGSIPVYLVTSASGGVGSIVTIDGPLLGGAVWVSGGVYITNPVTGVNVLNWPSSSSVTVLNHVTASVSGTATVSGTGVFFVHEQNPVTSSYVLGTASVSVSNWPEVQQVSLSGALPVTISGSQGVYIQDNAGNPIIVSTDGQRAISVSDEAVFNVLDRILTELKKMNIQLAIMTDHELGNEELD